MHLHALYCTRMTHQHHVLIQCHDSSRVSAMPTNRAYGTCYAIATNMLTHGLH
eukprot:COSAG05_NODE_24761_length_219_cov_2040.550000_1_plen_52_part_01